MSAGRFVDLSVGWLIVVFGLAPLILVALAVGALPFPSGKRSLLFTRRR